MEVGKALMNKIYLLCHVEILKSQKGTSGKHCANISLNDFITIWIVALKLSTENCGWVSFQKHAQFTDPTYGVKVYKYSANIILKYL